VLLFSVHLSSIDVVAMILMIFSTVWRSVTLLLSLLCAWTVFHDAVYGRQVSSSSETSLVVGSLIVKLFNVVSTRSEWENIA
jgi:hypothetical protein